MFHSAAWLEARHVEQDWPFCVIVGLYVAREGIRA